MLDVPADVDRSAHPALDPYLRQGEQAHGTEPPIAARYIPSHRRPWWFLGRIDPPPIDLRTFETGAALVTDPSLMDAARYLGGPPVSESDLDTLAEMSVATRKKLTRDLGQRAALVIRSWFDQERFPWLFTTPVHAPTPAERNRAIHWTAGLMTVQQVQTARRNESARRQQEAVHHLLRSLGFSPIPRRPIEVLIDVGRRQFCVDETLVAGTKCDIVVGLRNGCLLLIECKASNSDINSVKRLNREVGGKAGHWKEVFGEQAYTAAVLAGVYKLKSLQDAQDAGVFIFWQHDLSPLTRLLQDAV